MPKQWAALVSKALADGPADVHEILRRVLELGTYLDWMEVKAVLSGMIGDGLIEPVGQNFKGITLATTYKLTGKERR